MGMKKELYVVDAQFEVTGPPGYKNTIRKLVHSVITDAAVGDVTIVEDGPILIESCEVSIKKTKTLEEDLPERCSYCQEYGCTTHCPAGNRFHEPDFDTREKRGERVFLKCRHCGLEGESKERVEWDK